MSPQTYKRCSEIFCICFKIKSISHQISIIAIFNILITADESSYIYKLPANQISQLFYYLKNFLAGFSNTHL